MTDLIKLDDLKQQANGLWTAGIDQNAMAPENPRLFTQLQSLQDLSSDNWQLNEQAKNFDELMQLSPQRANLLRAFTWQAPMNVLALGGSAAALTRFLAEQDVHVDAVETDYAAARIAALRTQDFDKVRLICHPFMELDFQNNRYDVILLIGLTESLDTLLGDRSAACEESVNGLLSRCRRLLTERGRIILTADNPQGVKYLLGATDEREIRSYAGFDLYDKHHPKSSLNLREWHDLFAHTEFGHIGEYYAFADYRFCSVLLNRNYVQSNPLAFQHLEGLHSRDYFKPMTFGITESLLYQACSVNGHLGDFANSYLFTLGTQPPDQAQEFDFVHFPDFRRRMPYRTMVIKYSTENVIRRIPVAGDEVAGGAKLKQNTESEPYYPGMQLAVLWQRSILTDPQGYKFEQYLLDYFEFLKKLNNGLATGMNIDAIANNIIVDSEGEYHLIDHEWHDSQQKIKKEFIFYRAMIHFAIRNNSIFNKFKWINHLTTLGDFVIYCFKVIGINAKLIDVETLRIQDCEFLFEVLHESKGYRLSDPFGIPKQNKLAPTFVTWRYSNEFYNTQDKVIFPARTDNKVQQLIFKLPSLEKPVECFRFYPFADLQTPFAGYFGIESLAVTMIDTSGNKQELLNLADGDEVNKNNIHSGVFYAEKDTEHVFMFNNNNTFLEFELPEYQSGRCEAIQISINFRLAQSHDYEIARYRYGLVEREIQDAVKHKQQKIESLEKHLKELTEKYEQVKYSNIWRLLEAYRDSFKISGHPRKNIFGKLIKMIKKFKKAD